MKRGLNIMKGKEYYDKGRNIMMGKKYYKGLKGSCV